jgi:REP element-mobilizing transposase RayT
MNDTPLGFFITWTVYGTFLQGDARWWRKRGKGHQPPQPLLEQWHRNRLKHDVILLMREQRAIVEVEIRSHCDRRAWKLWAVNARSNHVHVVVTAPEYSGKTVRNQFKANCTRGLREWFAVFRERPVWSVGGDWECLNTEDDLAQAVTYVEDSQDRMGRNQG